MSSGTNRDVLVVGAGIAGLQSSLLLAERGHHVWLLESAPAIGGFFPLLDRTFPTNSCGVCFMSPTPPAFCPIYESEFHENITLITHAELRSVSGEAGDFHATYVQKPRLVDANRCTLCDRCAEACPVEVDREFGAGLEKRKAIYLPFPQAIPRSYVVDVAHCTRCGACVDACPVDAIELGAEAAEGELHVGAIVLGFGFEPFLAERRGEYGLGRYANVLSSVQYERMLSLSGPSAGMPIRPSDGRPAKRVAFIQCVGSRDTTCGQPHCSTICCMYATKQAMLSRARDRELEATVFYMDVRAMGKGYERYVERAKQDGIRFVRSSVSTLRDLKRTSELRIRYASDDGTLTDETFDVVVLSTGFTPPSSVVTTAELLGVELAESGFCRTEAFAPSQTSRPGVVVAGAFRRPMDIPETVVGASAAAARVMAAMPLEEQRIDGEPPNDETPRAAAPADADSPSVSVFLCDSRGMLRAGIPVDELIAAARTDPVVQHVEEIDATVLRDGAERVAARLTESRSRRIVLAGYRVMSLRNALLRLDGRLASDCVVEYTSLGEQCVSVHARDPFAALQLAQGQLRASIRKAALAATPQRRLRTLNPRVVIVGGGVAGLACSVSLASQGSPVTLLEKSAALGGNALQGRRTIDGDDVRAFASELAEQVRADARIDVLMQAELHDLGGVWGAYRSVVSVDGEESEIEHGAVVFAVGGEEAVPDEYSYGDHPGVVTQRTFEQLLAEGDARASAAKSVVMIQCVGSRDDEHPYCSHVCCTHAVKNALRFKESHPDASVVVLYRDMRTYGPYEDHYRAARDRGVLFVRFDPDNKPSVTENGDVLRVSFRDPVAVDTFDVDADLVVLSVGIRPAADVARLAEIAGLDLDPDGFFAEANPKSAPLDAVDRGKFFCGLCHSPQHIDEAILQGEAAAARAAALLWRGVAELADNIAVVNERRCAGCGLCVTACPYDARRIDEVSGKAVVLAELCKGCGTCVVACPNAASQQESYERTTVMNILDEVMT